MWSELCCSISSSESEEAAQPPKPSRAAAGQAALVFPQEHLALRLPSPEPPSRARACTGSSSSGSPAHPVALTLLLLSVLPDSSVNHWDISFHSKPARYWECWDSSLQTAGLRYFNLFIIFWFSHGSFSSRKQALELNWISTEMQEISIFFLLLRESCHPILPVCSSCVELHPPPSQGKLILYIAAAAGGHEKVFRRY